MAGKIPQSFIDELLARTDIVELIDGFVPLKKAGKDFQACCPFHDEKTPSFTVSQPKQFYHCFGCGANGTAISFLMEYKHLEFLDAIEELANRNGMPIPREAGQAKTDNRSAELYELMELVVRYYGTQLREHPQAGQVVDYLKKRGISGEVARDFELGYAPAGWDNLIKELGSSEAGQERLGRAGRVIQRDGGGFYDRFRERLMFPIRDQRGRVIGFGGRVLKDEDTPKYLNSPETAVFHKGRELYGLYQARQSQRDLERVYVVEGYMDVIALAQFGIKNAVASLGTAATPEHLQRLFRSCPEIVFCFDGDNAGKKAAARAMETSLALMEDGRRVFFRFLPEGMDPDDFVRDRGAQSFLDNSDLILLSDHMINVAKSGNDLSTIEGRSVFMKNMEPMLAQLPEGVFRQLMLQQVEELTGLNKSSIAAKLPEKAAPAKTRVPLFRTEVAGMTRISWVIALLLRQPSLATLVEEPSSLEKCQAAGVDTLVELLQSIHESPEISTAQLLERWRESRFNKRFHELSSMEVFDNESLDLSREFLDAIQGMLEEAESPFLEARNVNLADASEELKSRLRNLQKGN